MVVITREDIPSDDESDILDYVSEGGEDELDMEDAPECDKTHPRSIVILNTPEVVEERVDRLKGVIRKFLCKVGPEGGCGEVEIEMMINEKTGQTWGMVFATYEHKDFAREAIEKFNNMPFDGQKLRVFGVDQLDQIMNRSEEFDESKHQVDIMSRHDERDWLLDEGGREQLLLRYGEETEIHWVDANGLSLCYGGEREKVNKKVWCDSRVEWSAWGSFLCTFHRPGIVLWAGPEFVKKNRILARDVKCISFAPDEKHVITWDGSSASEGNPEAVKFMETRTGEEKRCFKCPEFRPTRDEYPLFLWSPDGQYFARALEKDVAVYSIEDMQMIPDDRGKRCPIKYDSLTFLSWSPKQNCFAVFSPEVDANPGRLTITAVPSRKDLVKKNLFSIGDAQLHWQSEGDFLCLQVIRLSKSKKSGHTSLEIFRMREKNIPVEMLELKEVVKHFSWETRKNRFAILTENSEGKEWKMQFYSVGKTINKEAVIDLTTGVYNNISWGPYGSNFVLSALGSGELQFCSLTENNKVEMYHKDDHFMVTQVKWDPSARYVLTAVTQPMGAGGYRVSSEAGFTVWSFQGRALHKVQRERLWAVDWRPHPPSLLPNEKIEHMQKNVKEYSKKYDGVDDFAKDSQRRAVQQGRRAELDDFGTLISRLGNFMTELFDETGFKDSWARFKAKENWDEVTTVVENDLSKVEELIKDH